MNLFVDVLDGVLDYPTWFQLVPAFQTSTGNLSALAEVVLKAQGAYRTGLFGSGAFSENHDQPRIPSLTNDIAVSDFRGCDGLMFTRTQEDQEYHGIPFHPRRCPHPLLRYAVIAGCSFGQSLKRFQARSKVTPAVVTLLIVKRKTNLHVMFRLDVNPYDRLWLSGYVEEKELVDHVKTLNAARKAAIAACPEYLATPMTFPEVTSTTLAVYKHPMLALFTNVGSNGTASWHVQDTDYPPGMELLEVFSCSKVSVDRAGGVSVSSTNGEPRLYIPVSAPFKHC